MKKLIAILSISFLSAQTTSPKGVCINCTDPTEDMDVQGRIKSRTIDLVTTAEYVIVTNADGVHKKILLSSLMGNNNGTCPNFLKNISSGYAIHFSSPSSVPNPNNPLNIQGKNFSPAAAWITGNTYYYSWSNTTGQPININNMTVNFSGLICNYQ